MYIKQTGALFNFSNLKETKCQYIEHPGALANINSQLASSPIKVRDQYGKVPKTHCGGGAVLGGLPPRVSPPFYGWGDIWRHVILSPPLPHFYGHLFPPSTIYTPAKKMSDVICIHPHF